MTFSINSNALNLGSIAYINSLPVDMGFLTGKVSMPARWVAAVPAMLNALMAERRLDVSPVSSFWFARHSDSVSHLPGLSISSETSVRSVVLLSRRPLRKMGGAPIAVTSQGQTTPVLLEILCRQRYGFHPEFSVGDPIMAFQKGAPAALVIGDDALLWRRRLGAAARHVKAAVDLAEEWTEWTGLPFVFALWAVRRETAESRPEAVAAVLEAIRKSRTWGLKHRAEVLDEACRKTGLTRVGVERYFRRLSYGFDARLKRGLSLFWEKAAECGLLSGSVELTAFGRNEVLYGR